MTRRRAPLPPEAPIVYGALLDDATEAWPGRNLLMLELARHQPVVLLERSASPDRKPWSAPVLERLDHNLYVMRSAGWQTESRKRRAVEHMAAAAQRRLVRNEMARLGWTQWLLWLTVADPLLLRTYGGQHTLFDCMDPNFLPEHERRHERRLAWIAHRSTTTVASAHALRDQMLGLTDACHLLPNAADPAAAAPDADLMEHWRTELRLTDGRPVVGYLGTADFRIDPDLLHAVALALPEVDLVLAGRVNRDQQGRLAPVLELPNVRVTGQLEYDDGYAVNALFDVGLIPFTPGPMNDCINSVKMFMYLISGIPVVSSWTRECRLNEFVQATRDADEMVAAIRRVTDGSYDPEPGRAWAEQNTWRDRATQALELLHHDHVIDAPRTR